VHGLPPNALCPGYGLAEASLAVAIASPKEPWSSVRVDSEALAGRQWGEVADGGVELVSCGAPLLDVQLRTSEIRRWASSKSRVLASHPLRREAKAQ